MPCDRKTTVGAPPSRSLVGNHASRGLTVWLSLPGIPYVRNPRRIPSVGPPEKSGVGFAHRPTSVWQVGDGAFDMKAKIIITPKKAVVDPQGKTVQNALIHMGYTGIGAVHVGKYLEIDLDGADPASARQQLEEACHRFLSNPVIEDYRLEIDPT